MALGTVVSKNQKRAICIMAAANANVAAPTADDAGVPCHVNDRVLNEDTGHSFPRQPARESTLMIYGDIKAVLAVDGPASATWNTILVAVPRGETDGEAVTFTATADGTGTGSITVVGTAVTFHYETAVTTVANFEAALAASAAASLLMRVMTAGTTQGYALLVGDDDFAATPLAWTTGALAGTFTLWGYLEAADVWFEIPTMGGTEVTPVALAETQADIITHTERYYNLGHYDRLALQLAGIAGGSGAEFSAYLVTAMEAY